MKSLGLITRCLRSARFGCVAVPFALSVAAVANPVNVATQGHVVSVTDESVVGCSNYIIDGITDPSSNRWTAASMPQTLIIDLGRVYDLTRFELFPYLSRPYRYTIEGVLGGGQYTILVDRSQNSTQATVLADDIPAVAARYIRLKVTGLAPNSYTGSWVNIHELKCFGVPNSDPLIIDSNVMVTGGVRVDAGIDLVSGGMNIFKDSTLYSSGATPEIRIGYDLNQNPILSFFSGDPSLGSSPGLIIDPDNSTALFQNLNVAITGSLSLNGSPALTSDSAASEGFAKVIDGKLTLSGANSGIYNASGDPLLTFAPNSSVAIGSNTTASGYQSVAIGRDVTSLNDNSIVLGTYNLGVTSPIGSLESIFELGNGDGESYGNAITTLRNGQTTLTNKAWKWNPSDPLSLPSWEPESFSNGEALVVEGHTRFKGKVVIEHAQGDISMGAYE